MDILGIGKLVAQIWDDSTLSKEEKLQQTNGLVEKKLENSKEIIVAEMGQGDNYTKRARPTVVYFGLLAIALNEIILPWAAYFIGMFCTKAGCSALPEIALPTEFWWTWTSICSVWFAGRSAEKRGAMNKVIKAITG